MAAPGLATPDAPARSAADLAQRLWPQIQAWARALGFSQIGVADVDLQRAEPGLQAWLDQGWHGEMGYMAAHGLKRARPAELVPGTLRVLTARMDYLPRLPATGPRPEALAIPSSAPLSMSSCAGSPAESSARSSVQSPGQPAEVAAPAAPWQAISLADLHRPGRAVLSHYARGRDYHKVLRRRLQQLADRMAQALGPFGHRVFTDSAPVLEVELAQRSGLGWRGKHTLLLQRDAGSMFFLGELFVDLPLPLTPPVSGHCGSCRACLDACPTGAIVAPYRLDARRCISYLTIELDGPIPERWRPAIGNRIYGCDDCQLVCPWNKFAQRSPLADFDARAPWHRPGQPPELLQLWAWDEAAFLRQTEGSAVRRIGFRRWRRNLAVALGNALRAPAGGDGLADAAQRLAIRQALQQAWPQADPMVAEHIAWALG